MDASTLNNITSWLAGGWVSIALAVIAIGVVIWWAIFSHNAKVDAATKTTEADRDKTETGEAAKTTTQDQTDQAGRDATDKFLGDSTPK